MSRAGRNFMAAAANVIIPVKDFGEDFSAHLLNGKVVSEDDEYKDFADVFINDLRLAVQVKMCNQRHAPRPTREQVCNLYKETRGTGFITDVDHGVYSLVFYSGVKTTNGRTKSKLLNRKLGDYGKRKILAEDLQCVYIVDIHLMHLFATDSSMSSLRKSGGVRVWGQTKLRTSLNRPILYINRTFLRGFVDGTGNGAHSGALNQVFGKSWDVIEKHVPVEFADGDNVVLERKVPVRIIGSKELVRKIRFRLGRRRRPMLLNKKGLV